jgi:multimeric flavodoxin WrbA
MKKILGIVGSPRKLGNCEIFIKEILRNIPEAHTSRLLRLHDFAVEACRGCYRCLFKENGCPQKDDFNLLLHAILDADALIVAVPTYFLGPNACLKRFIDRGLGFYAHAEELWGKPAVGVGIAGIDGKEGYTLLGIENFLKLLLADIKMTAMIYGALPGEVFVEEKNRNAAADLARALFSGASPKKQPNCPLCGGDTFRFLDERRVRCMLCSNAGTLSVIEGRPVFSIGDTGHELFLSKEGVVRHREWLKGMKNRFVEQKDRLRDITGPYRKEGTWIAPADDT